LSARPWQIAPALNFMRQEKWLWLLRWIGSSGFRRLTPFLQAQIGQQPVEPEQRARFLKVAWSVAERRVKEILDKNHWRAYERAALLVGAVAEARTIAGDPESGHALLANVRQQFSRYSAFTRELDKITRRSPLLPSSPAKHRRW
jgi:hypothetical protein